MGARLTVAELAEKVGGAFSGDGTALVTGLASIREAGTGDLSFVTSSKYAGDAAESKATAVLVPPDWDKPGPSNLIRVDDPDAAFTAVTSLFAPPPVEYPPGVHPSAVIAADAELGEGVSIGPQCVVGAGTTIGPRTIIMAGCSIGPGVTVGEDCRLYPLVSIREYCRIGDRVLIHDGTVVGSDGFGYVVDEQGHRTKVSQVGIVEILNDVELGANVTIDRARFGKTRIGNGVKIDNLVQIAHNVVVGDHVVIVAQVAIAGSCDVGKHAIIAGQAGIAGHLTVGAGAVVLGGAGVTKDVPPKAQVFGYPAMPAREAMRLHAHYAKLPQLKARVAELEKRLADLEEKSSS